MLLIRPSSVRAPLLSALVAAALAAALGACAIAPLPLGENQQPIVDEDEDADEEACSAGVALAGEPGPSCSVLAGELCFSTAEEACACAGCGLDTCAIAESFPAQAFCQGVIAPGSDPDRPVSDGAGNGSGDPSAHPGPSCPFTVDGACFENADSACRAASCAADACLILESFPAQIRCSR